MRQVDAEMRGRRSFGLKLPSAGFPRGQVKWRSISDEERLLPRSAERRRYGFPLRPFASYALTASADFASLTTS